MALFWCFNFKKEHKKGNRAKCSVPHYYIRFLPFISVAAAANKQNCDSKQDYPSAVVVKKVAQAVVIHYVSSEGLNVS